MKKMQVALLVTALAAVTASPATATPMYKDQILFTDPAGDARLGGQTPPEEFGLDLIEGRIKWASANPEMVTFEAFMTSMWEVASIPFSGSQGEWVRLVWHFAVGKRQYRLTLKTTDLGKPDAFAGSGMERVGTMDGRFRLEQCTPGTTPLGTEAVYCETIEYLEEGAAIDVFPARIAISVPYASIGAKSGSVIKAGGGGLADVGCEVCWIADVAERADDPETIVDAADVTRTFRMP